MSDGNRTSTSVKIPVGDMAREFLGQIFPRRTAEQVEAIKAGEPVPPSPDYKGGQVGVAMTVTADEDKGRIRELGERLDRAERLLKEKVRIEGILDGFVAAMADDGP